MKSSNFDEVLTELFTYHPPKTPEDQAKHDTVNQATIEFVETISALIDNPAELTLIVRKAQELKMMANLAISNERIGVSCRDLFSEGPWSKP